MKKLPVILLILSLILFTAIIKNSTKRIDDEIFSTKEKIRGFKKDHENLKLEHDYLSSAQRLLEFQNLYFDDELIKKNLQDINIIIESLDNLEIKPLKIINE